LIAVERSLGDHVGVERVVDLAQDLVHLVLSEQLASPGERLRLHHIQRTLQGRDGRHELAQLEYFRQVLVSLPRRVQLTQLLQAPARPDETRFGVVGRDQGDQLLKVKHLERLERFAESSNPSFIILELRDCLEPGVDLRWLSQWADNRRPQEPKPTRGDGVVEGPEERLLRLLVGNLKNFEPHTSENPGVIHRVSWTHICDEFEVVYRVVVDQASPFEWVVRDPERPVWERDPLTLEILEQRTRSTQRVRSDEKIIDHRQFSWHELDAQNGAVATFS